MNETIKKIDELRKQIDKIGYDIGELRECQLNLRQRVANILCPVKVGEIYEIKGYSFKGKLGKIEKILPCEVWDNEKYVHGWKVTMRVLKKNGETSDNITEVRQDQWQKNNA